MPAAAVAFYALIVEDDLSTSEFVAKALRQKGFESEAANSVGEALLRVEEEWPQAVILDLRLPDADGTVLLRRLRRDIRKTHIAVVTGVADLTSYVGLTQFPPDILLGKPIDLAKLIRWLEKARQQYEASTGGP
jgi:two-component system, response regulator RegA